MSAAPNYTMIGMYVVSAMICGSYFLSSFIY